MLCLKFRHAYFGDTAEISGWAADGGFYLKSEVRLGDPYLENPPRFFESREEYEKYADYQIYGLFDLGFDIVPA